MAEPCKHCGGTGLEPFVDGSMRYAEHPMTQPHTDAGIVARAIAARTTPGYWDAHHHADLLAEIATSALSAAGRLQPADAKREWTIAFRGTPITCLAGQVDEAGARFMVDNDQDGNVTAVSRWVGPWLPVPEEGTDRES